MAELGGATTLYICPTCGCPDLMQKQSSLVIPAKERDAKCPNCDWKGKLSEAAGIATTEKVFDTKTVLNLLLYVVSKHAAGPIAQAFQFFGLIDKGDQAGLDKIMRAATEGLIERAFMAAAEHAASKGNLADPPLERASSEQEWADRMPFGDGPEKPKIVLDVTGPPRIVGGEAKFSMEDIEITRVDRTPEDLHKVTELLDQHTLRADDIVMDQQTAREIGVDVDALSEEDPT